MAKKVAKNRPRKSQNPSVFLSKKKGMALVITMILVPILLGLGASFIDPIMRSYKSAASDQKTVLAKNVAENLFEIALEETRDLGVGDDADSDALYGGKIKIEENYGTGTGQWWVFGSPELDEEHTFEMTGPGDRWYTIPAAGSGNAGGDYCSTNDPAVTMEEINTKLLNLGVNTTDIENVTLGDDPFEWPCHWNKLYEGQTVSIPLYVDGINGVQNPADLELNEFELRIRTACDLDDASGEEEIYKGEICNNHLDERYELDGSPFTIMVIWEIIAEEVDSNNDPTGRSIVISPHVDMIPIFDSNIKIMNINDYETFKMSVNSKTVDNDNCPNKTILDHLNNTSGCTHQDINKPILNFTLIHTLQDINSKIPYLEYQFRTPRVTEKPSIASNEKLIRTEVMLDGGYSEAIEKSIDLTKPVTGFVIQQ